VQKKLTITVDEDVYEGIHKRIARRNGTIPPCPGFADPLEGRRKPR